MTEFDFDLFVIGAGSGGVRTARMAAARGVRVAVAEDRYLGGTCVNVGCVPKKLYAYAAHYAEDFVDARGFGWQTAVPAFDWATLRDNKRQEIQRLNGIYRNLLSGAGCTLIDGRATLLDPHTVAVGDKRYRAERILLATGGWPFVPDFPGSEHVISSNEVFDLPDFPQRMVVVGGGYIAVEFAGIFAGLGAVTHQLYRGDLFLRGFDREVREFVAEEMRKKHVDLRFNTDVERIEIDGAKVSFFSGDKVAVGEYASDGHEILTYAKGNRGVRFIFKKVSGDAAAPGYFQFSDHKIAPEKADHYHIYMGDDRAKLLEEVTNWPTYYPAALTPAQIVAEMQAH